MTLCPCGVDTKMLEYVVNRGFDISTISDMKLLKPENVAEKIYDMISNQEYGNGQSIEFYNN
ncbi:MAG: hypothetical protein ACPKPY_09380 [Nitrososphaeraceae archaeon]